MTPPHPLGVTILKQNDIDAFVQELYEKKIRPNGIIGPKETTAAFSQAWTRKTNCNISSVMNQLVYQIVSVTDEKRAMGKMRTAELKDLETLKEWLQNFLVECNLQPSSLEKLHTDVLRVIHKKTWFVWETPEGAVVAMAGLTGETPNGNRIGAVYTPIDRRGKGYASSIVAELSQHVLNEKKYCFLFTDLANPTSNSIYKRIGYKIQGECSHHHFKYT